jgi:hypothetical protein
MPTAMLGSATPRVRTLTKERRRVVEAKEIRPLWE